MTGFILYIILASACLSLFYIGYRLVFRNETNFVHARIYLLLSIGLSLIIPLNNYQIEPSIFTKNKAVKSQWVILPDQQQIDESDATLEKNPGIWETLGNNSEKLISWAAILYLTISAILFLRILIQLIILVFQYVRSDKVRQADCVLLYNHRFRNTFSFFRWIYLHKDIASDDELDQIITHEKIHINQYHSFDLILIELLAAAMWFNPFIRLVKKSVQLVHEYLADKGALDAGIDRLRYQALLINQVSEERLICLSSSFNHSLIKKRIIMMTKAKFKKEKKLRILAILPLSVALIFIVAILHGIFSNDAQASVTNQNLLMADNTGSVTPPDTIIKKTVIKTVNMNHPQDTIVEESEDIIIKVDGERHEKMPKHEGQDVNKHIIIKHSGDKEDVTRHENQKVYKQVTVIHSGDDGEDFVWQEGQDEEKIKHSGTKVIVLNGDTDSVKVVTFTGSGDDEDQEMVSHSKKVVIRHSDDMESFRILWIIDGVKHTEKDAIKDLDPDKIQQMTVIKGEDTKKYTSEEYDGVIVITTKKK